jgi:ATP-binding cassette, subfamily C (CFTR/MRP), member 1
VLSTGSIYLTATIVPLLLAVYVVQFVYLRTSRQLRFLDLEAKSPLYTHFLETTQGLATIRAFGWQHEMRDEGVRLLDYSQKPFYLMTAIQRWLSLVLSLIISAEAVLVVGLALGLRHMTSPGLLGISLNTILGKPQIPRIPQS